MTNARSLANFATGIGTEGAVLTVDNTNNRIGIATTNPQNDLQVGLGITMEVILVKSLSLVLLLQKGLEIQTEVLLVLHQLIISSQERLQHLRVM